ncbi:RNA pseudouridine synthase [Bdellovibrio sp. 22V]|uniref:RluA family pseudouridine synthase n=1 Tax=Bdellovibrio TaxID=958 RepID=UPI002542743F|nr:RNA pseudouridine synthase [Bdellovibrio sp. 22V]WII71433.1 RNA pseudouridine synthase [Bdellovibrio sp. 22V]
MNNVTALPIIEKSKNWLVIDKPPGVSVHNEAGDVRELLKKQLPKGSYHDIYPVHRLDKETSGLLLIATEQETAAELAEQFQKHQTEKIYYAVLRGAMPVSQQWQEWSSPISDKAEGRKNPQGLSKDRVEARTLYRVLQANQYFSLVELQLLTGRQHQIRKHTALAKHAIVGDSRYGDPKYNERMAQIYKTDRMFLHAAKLTLNIGSTAKTFTAPLPEDFKNLVK